jgi:hypothetical protein
MMMLQRVLAGSVNVPLLRLGLALADGDNTRRGSAESMPDAAVVVATVER